MGPVFRYYYVKNNSSISVIAVVNGTKVSNEIKAGSSDRVEVWKGHEVHNVNLGVVSADGKQSASAGSFFTIEDNQLTVYTAASGDENGLTLSFNGFGSDPGPSNTGEENYET